jgi:hypothetical protein
MAGRRGLGSFVDDNNSNEGNVLANGGGVPSFSMFGSASSLSSPVVKAWTPPGSPQRNTMRSEYQVGAGRWIHAEAKGRTLTHDEDITDLLKHLMRAMVRSCGPCVAAIGMRCTGVGIISAPHSPTACHTARQAQTLICCSSYGPSSRHKPRVGFGLIHRRSTVAYILHPHTHATATTRTRTHPAPASAPQ